MNHSELSGSILRNFRLEYGLTQKAVADRAGCCERHYRRIEHGKMTPSVLLSIAICSVLDTDVYEVWG